MDDFENGNLDVYERKMCYDECEKMYTEAVIFINKRLVRLIDMTGEQCLYLKYGDHTMVSNEVKESVIATWLIQSYKKQFDEYIGIKKQKEVYRLDAGMEYDPSNVDFGDDEVVITDDELSNLGDGNLIEENEVAQIFKIDTDIFHFKTPLYAWIYEWNKRTPLLRSNGLAVMPMLDYGPWMEPSDDKKEKYCNGRDLPGVIRKGDMIYFESYEWYENLKEGELKDEALNSKAIFEGSKEVDEEPSDNARTHYSPSDEWEDFEHANHIGADANSNYNPYLDVSKIFNHGAGTNNEQFDEHELIVNDDDDIGDLGDYLIKKDSPYCLNKEEERSKERRCKLLGIPYVKSPTCKSKKFEVVKYSFRPAEGRSSRNQRNTEYDIWGLERRKVLKSTKIFFERKTKDGAYDLGVATPRAVVHAGDKTSGDARSWYMISGDAKSWVKRMTVKVEMCDSRL
ncbi:hypothetical protein Tco_0815174 [Tanacetum coccineum]